jgi:thiol-disulfide isomerase/thioredoxin
MWWLWWFGCAGGEPVAAPASRVDAVAAPQVTPQQLEAFCDQRATAETARAFPLPATTPPLVPASTWRWINLWATWCGPCVAEMPTLARWEKRLANEAVPADLVFVSVDRTDAEVSRFLDKHPGLPHDVRLEPYDQLPAWFEALGVAPDTAIPLHVFVDPDGRVRCVRAGAINPADYPLVKALISG